MIVVALLAAALIPLPRVHQPGAGAAGYEKVPPPDLDMKISAASATTVPWIDGNGWRFLRGVNKALYAAVPEGKAPLAAAEAFAYGVDALIEPAPSDDDALKAVLEFLAKVQAEPLPARVNFAIVKDDSDELDEVLNLLTRRNLLYRVVTKPDPRLELNIRIGSKDWPRSEAEDPNLFAAKVRAKIGDDNRLVRVFNTYTVIAHLTGSENRSRLHLLNYARRPARDVRVRVLGRYKAVALAEAHDPKAQAADVLIERGAVELTIPRITTYAVIDLK